MLLLVCWGLLYCLWGVVCLLVKVLALCGGLVSGFFLCGFDCVC